MTCASARAYTHWLHCTRWSSWFRLVGNVQVCAENQGRGLQAEYLLRSLHYSLPTLQALPTAAMDAVAEAVAAGEGVIAVPASAAGDAEGTAEATVKACDKPEKVALVEPVDLAREAKALVAAATLMGTAVATALEQSPTWRRNHASHHAVKGAITKVLLRRRVALRRHEAALASQYRRQHMEWIDQLDERDLTAAYDVADKVARRMMFPLAAEPLPEEPKEKWGTIGARCPTMILDTEERRVLRFNSKNALVRDPLGEMQAERTCNPWTVDEQRIFAERFQLYNKDFRRISTFLRNRTVADCVVFYYKRQKDTSGFRRKTQLKKRRQYSEAKRTPGGLDDAARGPYANLGSGAASTSQQRGNNGTNNNNNTRGGNPVTSPAGTPRQEAVVRGKGMMSPQMLKPSGSRDKDKDKPDEESGKKRADRGGTPRRVLTVTRRVLILTRRVVSSLTRYVCANCDQACVLAGARRVTRPRHVAARRTTRSRRVRRRRRHVLARQRRRRSKRRRWRPRRRRRRQRRRSWTTTATV
jgi:hypothetical protein